MSIDAPFTQIDNSKTNSQNFNYIDTYVEYFAEVILKYENSIPESKNRHHKDLQQHNHAAIIFQSNEQVFAPFLINRKNSKQTLFYNDKYPYQFIKEIKPPPPKLS